MDPLRIHFIDEVIIVIEKLSGLLTVPGKAEGHQDCLESRIKQDYADARVVHRLDMDTSGLIVLARTADAHRHLGLQFEKRYVDKTYEALVWGLVEPNSGAIDKPLRCDWPNRPKQMIDFELGRSAMTKFEVIERCEDRTRVKLHPLTGRSHQLRVHMLDLGHPILGDNLYAHRQAHDASSRLCLHANGLRFRHPNGGKHMTFVSECPF